jgi:uncharacterized membrane protein
MDITPDKEMVKPTHYNFTHGEAFKHMFEGIHFKFPTFKHDHQPVMNVNAVADDQLTTGQRIADSVAATVGSWPFILIQSFILLCWLILNSIAWINHWDPYPFILLNLALSFQAAYAAPFVMMSQNRQAEKDRLTAQNDYTTDCKGEEEIRFIMEHLDHQDTLILQILQRIEAQHTDLLQRISQLDPELAKRLGIDVQLASEDIIEASEDVSGNS